MVEKETLRPEVIGFLVRAYSVKKWSPKLKWHMGSFSAAAAGKRHRMPGGMHVSPGAVGAAYIQSDHTLVVNADAAGDLEKGVTDVLHEVQHYNQHMRWDNDMAYRDRITDGKELPPDVVDDPIRLYEVSWDDMRKFWERRYGYRDSPHEVDARRFASKHLGEALTVVQEHLTGGG